MIDKIFMYLYGIVFLAIFSLFSPAATTNNFSRQTRDITTPSLSPVQIREFLPVAPRRSGHTKIQRNEPANTPIPSDLPDIFHKTPSGTSKKLQFSSANNSGIFIRQICKFSIASRDGPDHVLPYLK